MRPDPEQNLKIGWIGFHQEGIPALRGLLESGVELEAVITLEQSALVKRSAAVGYADVLAPYGVALHEVSNINDASSISLLQSLDLDLLLVIGWSQILHKAVLAAARLGVIGAHASLLPHNRGSAPINWALIRGETTAGNTLIWLTEGVDEGSIVDQMEFSVTQYDTCETLYEKVAQTNHRMIERILPQLFSGRKPGRSQPHTHEPILPRRRPADGLLNWNQPAQKVYDFVRALTRPYPGAFSFLDGQRWIIQSCALLPDIGIGSESAGMILGPVVSPIAAACGLAVAGSDGTIMILELENSDGQILSGTALSDTKWTGKVWTNE